MNCWNRSVFRFFFFGGSGGLSGGRFGSKSEGKVSGGMVAVLLWDKMLLVEVTDDMSVLMLLSED